MREGAFPQRMKPVMVMDQFTHTMNGLWNIRYKVPADAINYLLRLAIITEWVGACYCRNAVSRRFADAGSEAFPLSTKKYLDVHGEQGASQDVVVRGLADVQKPFSPPALQIREAKTRRITD
jgi:hypothetical protein